MKNKIDSIFKQHLEEVTVDNGMMAKDWQAMKTALTTFTSNSPKRAGLTITRKLFIAFAVSACTLVLVYFLWPAHKEHKPSQNMIAAGEAKKQIQPNIHNNTLQDTIKLISPKIKIAENKITIASPNPLPIKPSPLIIIPKPDTLKYDTIALKPVVPVVTHKSDRDILDSFYNALKTPTQLFTINNTKDTTIVGKDGSEITIPANSFMSDSGEAVTGSITILLDECYSYTDIVAHKLNTLSDSKMLESGGMLQITATANNTQVKLAKGKQLNITMTVKHYNEAMQLFTAKQCTSCDATAQINWQPAGQWQKLRPVPLASVINWRDDPFSIAERHGKLIGKFWVYKKAEVTHAEIIRELKKRYPEYSRIKLRRINTYQGDISAPWFVVSFSGDHYFEGSVIGDSISVSPQQADKWRLWTPEEKQAYSKKLKLDSAYWGSAARLEKKYSFRIDGLGWMNCDHFYSDPRPKVRYVINLGDTASNYISQLVFVNCRLAMPAETRGNYISFNNIPIGEPVQLVSIGVKNGKVVASVQKFTVSKEMENNVTFEEVTTDDVKRQLVSAGK